MNKLSVVLALASLSVAARPLFADGVGTPVAGVLHFTGFSDNYFDPTVADGVNVPPSVGNDAGTTVPIGSGVEFGYIDTVDGYLLTADFTGSTLEISDTWVNVSNGFELDFTDPAFAGFTQLGAVSPFTYSFSGDTLSVFFPIMRPDNGPNIFSTTFSYDSSDTTGVTPEPSSFVLLGSGLVGMVAGARRRLRGKGFGSSLIPGFAVITVLLLGASGARADQILVNQPAESPLHDLGGIFAINLFDAPTETFTLSQSSTIDSIGWQGSYATNNSVVPGTADATQFAVSLFHCPTGDCNDEQFPVFPSAEAFTPAQAHEALVGVADPLFLGSPIAVSVYNYQVNYTTPFTVAAGTYQLLLETTIPDETTAWFWDGGTGGDGVSLNAAFKPEGFDLSLSILGTTTPAATPEPSSLMLLGTGLIGVAAMARRRLART